MNLRAPVRESLPLIGTTALAACVIALAVASVPQLRSGDTSAAVSAAKVVSLTNAERTDEGLRTLERDALLDDAASMKAKDMAAKGYYAHVSPEGLTPMHWVEKAGYDYLIIGENLVVNRTDADQVVDAFMGSSGHRANILRKDFTEIGVGVANGIYKGKDATFTVQIFAAPYPQKTASTPAPKPAPAVKPSPPVKAPLPKPLPAVAVPAPSVPRTASSTPPLSTFQASTSLTSNPGSLPQQVITLVRLLLLPSEPVPSTSTSSASTTVFDAPSFSLNTAEPIELIAVSRLEADTLPIPLGSTWTMEVRSFVETFLLSARTLFAR